MFAAESERKIKSALDQLLQRQGGQVGQQGRRAGRGGDQFQNEIFKSFSTKLGKLWRAEPEKQEANSLAASISAA